jgi:hypothetical protein
LKGEVGEIGERMEVGRRGWVVEEWEEKGVGVWIGEWGIFSESFRRK